MDPKSPASEPTFAIKKSRVRFLGLSVDDFIRHFFQGNAVLSIVVLALITFFLFREGSNFFSQNQQNLRIYRQAGLEYVDYIRQQVDDHTALNRYLADVRRQQFLFYTKEKDMDVVATNAALASFDEFADNYSYAVDPLRDVLSELTDVASAIKTKFLIAEDKQTEREQLLAEDKTDEAAKVVQIKVDFDAELAPLVGSLPAYLTINTEFSRQLSATIEQIPVMPNEETAARMVRFQKFTREYIAGFPAIEERMEAWDYHKEVPLSQSFSAFLFGREWLTASFWQDWYGVVPLVIGSLMVSFVALILAVPMGVGAAIYVNQIATETERRFIKPGIEFISAIPSVVLGFFGIVVLGQALRLLSQQTWLEWVPGFPYSERLNILTAGCLLALIAVPTIFTLAEDALNNVPRPFKEASMALGASRLQTIIRIIVPASLSGIISAVLLGLGRVIGETMVVLLCAGNRIAIPDFTAGLAVITQPVHTMTGIIAQEMGEVVRGSIHYRALFVVGILLFFLALLINYLAQKIVHRYRISIG
jgi:phosphate transport system permease protein|uniref:phosphate ABC transporter permease subunit PstC n=1 Tax=Cephaloticoccus sp. TaxID=1985742 RepID=UPI00404B30F7